MEVKVKRLNREEYLRSKKNTEKERMINWLQMKKLPVWQLKMSLT